RFRVHFVQPLRFHRRQAPRLPALAAGRRAQDVHRRRLNPCHAGVAGSESRRSRLSKTLYSTRSTPTNGDSAATRVGALDWSVAEADTRRRPHRVWAKTASGSSALAPLSMRPDSWRVE